MDSIQFQKLTKLIFTLIFLFSVSIIFFYYSKTSAVILWSETCSFWLFIITLILVSTIWYTDGITYMVAWLICYTMSIYYYPRFVAYAVFPDQIQFANIPNQISTYDITNMLMVLAVYLLFVGITLIVLTRILKNQFYSKTVNTELSINIFNFLVFCLIVIVLEHLWTIITGINVYGTIKTDSGNAFFMFIKLFLKQNILFPIVLYLIIINESKEKKQFAFLLLILLIFMVSSSLWGSRIGPLRSLTYILFLLTFFSNKVNIKKLVIIIAVIFVTSFFTTSLANHIRVDRASKSDKSKMTSVIYKKNVSELNRLIAIVNRLGDSDFLTLSINKINHDDDKLSFVYTTKSILNYILPGLPFKEAPIQQSRMLPVLTGVVDWDYVIQPNKKYYSQPFTVWGQVYISGKLWLGGVILSLITAIIVFCGVFLNFLTQKYWQANLIIPFFYLIPIYGFWNLMAWDQYISNTISLSISFAIYFIIIIRLRLVVPKTRGFYICQG